MLRNLPVGANTSTICNSAEASSMRKPHRVCELSDLVPNSGIAILRGAEQIAIFYLPSAQPELYAINNYDPIGQANVLSRGVVGDLQGRWVVASPLYKQHFCLQTGECIEDSSVQVKTYDVFLEGTSVGIRDTSG